MMLGIEDYGSGSDNDSDSETVSVPPKSSLLSKLPPTKKSSISLPPPASSSSISLPPPKSKRGPKKITIGLPALSAPNDGDDDIESERPAAKKPRLESGAGSSSLLAMLPKPKQKNPTLPAPERVLGGGKGPGLVFNTSRPSATPVSSNKGDSGESYSYAADNEEGADAPSESSSTSFSFMPTSVAKGRSNISVEEGRPKAPARTVSSVKVTSALAIDFFSLGSSSTPLPTLPKSSTPSSTTSLSVSSAPVVPTFTPPEPAPTDPYPGYYQLPSGAWAQHDQVYYANFLKKWEKDYNAHVRALEKGMVKGFEGLETAAVEEVDAMKEMEKAKIEIQSREEKKAVTKGADGAPVAPKMNINAAKLGGMARSRHQLSTLLSEAYTNREALEERIAEGRRNRKEAGNKYGF